MAVLVNSASYLKKTMIDLHAAWKMTPKHEKQEFVTVLVRDPQLQKEDFWHSYIDYEIFIHTNSMCFTRKTSCVRRRFREFVWLRQKLQSNAVLIQLPDLPPKTPFFNSNNSQHVDQRRQGLQEFLQKVLQNPVLLSDSRLHLFVQTQLSPEDIEACVSGNTKYSVAEAIHDFACLKRRFPVEHEERKKKIMPIQILKVHPLGLNTAVMIAIHTDIKEAQVLKNPEILFALCCPWNDGHNLEVACDPSTHLPKHVFSVFKPVLKNIVYAV